MGITRQFIYWVNLDPTKGKEIKKRRPCLVLSPTLFNKNAGLVTIVPTTTKKLSIIHTNQIYVEKSDGCVEQNCKILVDQVRTIDISRVGAEIGKLPDGKYKVVKDKLKTHLNL